MALPSDESVRYGIEIDVKAALVDMRKLLDSIDTVQGKVVKFSGIVMDLSRKWKQPWQEVLAVMKQVNQELSRQKGKTMFGNVGGRDVFGLTGQYLTAAKAADTYVTSQDKVTSSVRNFDGTMNKAQKTTDTFMQRLLSWQNVLRTAFGTLLAIAIFNLLQFAQNAIRKAIQGVRDLEIAFYNLGNAERAMSESGIEISLKELEEVIDRISKKFKGMFSKVELQDAVADIAIAVKDLGFGATEIEKMLQAIAVVKLRTPDQTLKEVTSHTITALLSGRTQALQAMGISANEATVQEKALAMGLIETGEVLDTNTKALAILQIMYDATSGEAQDLSKYQNTLAGASAMASAAWTDFLTQLGKLAAPFIIEFLKLATDQLQKMNDWLVKNEEELSRLVAAFSGLARGLDVLRQMGTIELTIGGGWKEVIQAIYDGMQEAKKIADEFGESVETPTAEIQEIDNIDLSNAQQEIQDLIEDLERLDKKAAESERNFRTKMERMEEDHLRDMRDMEIDYQRDREDVLSDFNARRHSIERKYRDGEIDAEAKFQEQLRQLREKFLFALEDALRERDARQVLRLTRQYQMDKQAAINEHNLERQERKRRFQEEMADLEAQRDERLRQLEEEYEIRRLRAEEDYQIKKEREYADHAQDMEDLRREVDERLLEFARAIGEEYGLREEGVNAVYDLLTKFYGPGGFMDGLYDYTNSSMLAKAQIMLNQLSQMISQYNSMVGSAMSSAPTSGNLALDNESRRGYVGAQARGGTYLATSPTTATFGEAGPEVAMFIPLNKIGMPNPSSSISEAGGRSDRVEIALSLSPDLEARIVENSLDAAAHIITKVGRSK